MVRMTITFGDQVVEIPPFEIPSGVLVALQHPPLKQDHTTTAPPPAGQPEDQATRTLATKVFDLLTALDPDNRLRKASPIKVFNLYYRRRL
jgi:hypothetical protein